mgnify:CR=1 FL=1
MWLVEAGWLNGGTLKDRVIVADTRTEQQYMQGHIPGAVWLDISGIGARTSESALPLLHQELAAKFSILGITGAEQIVFYDESMGTKAPKALWFLTYAGYRWGRCCTADSARWQKAGLPVSTEKTVRPAKAFNVNANPAIFASTDYVAKRIRSSTAVILDVRSRDEYSGKDTSQHCARMRTHLQAQSGWNGHSSGEPSELPPGCWTWRNVSGTLVQLPRRRFWSIATKGNRASNTYLALQLLGYLASAQLRWIVAMNGRL